MVPEGGERETKVTKMSPSDVSGNISFAQESLNDKSKQDAADQMDYDED